MSKLHGNRIEVGNISTSNRNSLSNVNGHLVYNTDTNLLEYYNPSGWQKLGDLSPNIKSDYPTKIIDPDGNTFFVNMFNYNSIKNIYGKYSLEILFSHS